MTISQHISTATLLSFTNPIVGFFVGFFSHAILDTIEPQEYSTNLFDFSEDVDYKALEFILCIILISQINTQIMLWTILGAIIPDFIEGVLVLFDRSRYNTGNHLFWFHRGGSKHEMTKRQTMIVSIILCMVIFLA